MPEEKSRSSQDYIDLPGSASAGTKPAAGRAAEEKSDIHDAAAAGDVSVSGGTAEPEKPVLSPAMLAYLTAIVRLEQKNGKIRLVDIADELHVKKPSVCSALQVLRNAGCITSNGGRNIRLTDEGRRIGLSSSGREEFFCYILSRAGIDESAARQDACRMARAVSEESFQAMKIYEMKRRD
ncbi:MAG: metal-dependent transcriptional regulator [Oribacterium sp.]|nr:metal-dependent transcriptional regulator [Oribacterium sp.]